MNREKSIRTVPQGLQSPEPLLVKNALSRDRDTETEKKASGSSSSKLIVSQVQMLLGQETIFSHNRCKTALIIAVSAFFVVTFAVIAYIIYDN